MGLNSFVWKHVKVGSREKTINLTYAYSDALPNTERRTGVFHHCV